MYEQDEWGKKAATQGFPSCDVFVKVQHIVLTAVDGISVLLMDAAKPMFGKQVMKNREYAFGWFDTNVVLHRGLQMEVNCGVEDVVDTVEGDTAEVFFAYLGGLGIGDEIAFIRAAEAATEFVANRQELISG